MIVVRSPLRISLGGGGTDLPSYYTKFGGFLVAGAIDKYVYITLHDTFSQELIIKYSKLEQPRSIDEIEHPIIREALKVCDFDQAPFLEITSMADIPAGTGLGSSGSFTTALLKALHSYKRVHIDTKDLAELACHIELEKLKEPIGKQDQYIAAYGGLNMFHFNTDGSVDVKPLPVSKETLYSLEDNLLLFFTGIQRSASAILKEQDVASKNRDEEMLNNLHFVKELGIKSCHALEQGDLTGFAELMNEHWEYKKQRSSSMSSSAINEWYDLAMQNGALGGKLIGAGGGGFLMFYAEDKARLRAAMKQIGLKEVRFRFDFEGSRIVTRSA